MCFFEQTLKRDALFHNPSRHIVTDLAVHIRVYLSRRFSELAVFYARLYIRVRHIDEPA